MLAYVAKRLLGLVPVLLGVVFLVFSMLWLAPGDPVLALLGESAQGISAAQVEELRRAYGLDRESALFARDGLDTFTNPEVVRQTVIVED